MTDLERYATSVLDGEIVACDKIKKEYERLLNDLYDPGRWHFDEERAMRPISFIEKFCKKSQGGMGENLKLELYQKAMLQAAYGFVDDENLRRYREVLNIIGRKNGKTTLLSAIQLYMLIADGEGAPECYQIATTKDQASKGFTECLNMTKMSTLISRYVRKRVSDLYCQMNMGFIKALASNVNSLDGLNGHCIVIDELAAIKNRDVYDLMKQSMSARSQPMLWCITTNGFVRESIFDSQYEYAAGVINGTITDDRFLPIVYELDGKSEWDDPEKWGKANPGLGSIKDREFLEGCVEKAKNDATFTPTVLVKDFNLKENSDSSWLAWDELYNDELTPGSYKFRYAIGGFDAADSVDLTAAKLICMIPGDPKMYLKSMYWIPQSKLNQMKDRHHPDDVPYDIWVSRGLIRVCEGNRVDKRVILDWFLEMRDVEDIYPLYIGYDPWHIDDSLLERFKQEFGADSVIPVRQGVATLSQPMKDLKAEFQAHNVVYDANPIDRWCFSNTSVRTDVNGNIQPQKGRSQNKRIDGLAALLDAYVVLQDKRESFYSLI